MAGRAGAARLRAAFIYQHATAEADRAIAQALHEAVRADRQKSEKSAGKGKPKDTASKRGKERGEG